MSFEELMALLGTDEAPETVYDDLRSAHSSELSALTDSHVGILADRDSTIAQMQATIDTLKSQIFDAETNPDSDNPENDDNMSNDNDSVTIDDLFA